MISVDYVSVHTFSVVVSFEVKVPHFTFDVLSESKYRTTRMSVFVWIESHLYVELPTLVSTCLQVISYWTSEVEGDQSKEI